MFKFNWNASPLPKFRRERREADSLLSCTRFLFSTVKDGVKPHSPYVLNTADAAVRDEGCPHRSQFGPPPEGMETVLLNLEERIVRDTVFGR